MSSNTPHVCPASGGAHHFHLDENDVPLCACGELGLDPVDELTVIEIAHEGTTNPLPADRARSFYGKLADVLGRRFPDRFEDADARERWIDEHVDSANRPDR